MRALAATLVLLCASCGEDPGAFVFVRVEARPTVRTATTLRVSVENEGATRSQDFPLDDDFPVTFTVTPSGRTGDLTVTVEAIGEDGLVAVGGATTPIGGSRTDVTILLEPEDFVINRQRAETQWISFREDLSGRQVGVAPDRSFVVAWENSCPLSRCDILGRLFDAATEPRQNGTTLTPDDFIVQTSPEYTESASVAAGPDGYVIAWLAAPESGMPFDVKAVTLTPDGAHVSPFETSVTLTAEAEAQPGALAMTGGDYVVYWKRPRDPMDILAGNEVLAQLLDQDGLLLDAEIEVSASATGDMNLAHGAPLAGGGFVIVWEHRVDGETGNNVRARVFDATGKATTLLDIPVTDYDDATVYAPRVTALPDGGFAVAWIAFLFGDPKYGDYPVIVRLFDVTGNPRSTEVVVVPQTIDYYAFPTVAARPDGAVGVAWADCGERGDGSGCGVRFRLFRPNGMPAGDSFVANSKREHDQRAPSNVAFGDDAFLLAWTDTVMPPPSSDEGDVRGRVIYPSLDRADGTIGATCDPADAATCGEDLVCADQLCHQTCSLPDETVCPDGGTCRGGACRF